jgi:hypothetical protein
MRKITLLTIPLLIFGLFSLSADEMEMMGPEVNSPVTAEVSGEATLTWGIDLDTNATGFKSSSTSDLKITIVPEQSTNTGMMEDSDDLYAYIELNDFKWEVTSADGQGKTSAPSVTAKLIMGAFSITAESKPTIDVDFVDPKDDDKAGDPGFPDFTPDVATEYKGSGGLTLGYKIDPVTLSLGVLSANDWELGEAPDKDKLDCHTHNSDPTDDVADGTITACKDAIPDDGGVGNKDGNNDENAYAFIGTIGLKIGDNANLEAAVAYGHEYDEKPIGIGAKATFDLGDIDPHIAFDGSIPEDGAGIPWDVGGGVKWNLSADEKSSFSTELMMHAPADGDSTVGISATLKEGDADEGALEGLGASLTVDLNDLTGETSTWATTLDAHYKVEGIKPFFMVKFSNADEATTKFTAGLELSMIEHLTTTLQYKSDDITGGSDRGEVTAAIKISY